MFSISNHVPRTSFYINNVFIVKINVTAYIIAEDLCCSGIFEGPFFWKQKSKALDGSWVKMGRQHGQRINVDRNTPIVECDKTATNGIIHVIEKVLPSAAHKYFRHRWGDNHRRGHVADTLRNMAHGIMNNGRVQHAIQHAQTMANPDNWWPPRVGNKRNIVPFANDNKKK